MKKSMVAAFGSYAIAVILIAGSPTTGPGGSTSSAMFTSPVVAAAGAPGKVATGGPRKVRTDAKIGTKAPTRQATLLDQLRALAGPLNDAGKGSTSATSDGLRLNSLK